MDQTLLTLSEKERERFNSVLYFYIKNVINIIFIKAKNESHQVSVFKHFTFITK